MINMVKKLRMLVILKRKVTLLQKQNDKKDQKIKELNDLTDELLVKLNQYKDKNINLRRIINGKGEINGK